MRVAAILTVLTIAGSAGAAPTAAEATLARKLFDEGRTEERAEHWAAAIASLEHAAAIRETAAVRFHLGYCHERLGHLVEATLEYDRAAELVRPSDPDEFGLMLEQHRRELAARVPTVTLTLPAGVAAPALTVDGAKLSPQALGRPLPLNPGRHELSVTAIGRRPWQTSVVLTERQAVTLAVELPLAVETQVGSLLIAPAPFPAAEPRSHGSLGRTLVVTGEALVAVAGVGMIIGGALKADEASSRITADQADLAASTACTTATGAAAAACADLTTAFEDRDRAHVFTALGTGMVLAGGVAFAATWLLWSTEGTQTHVIERVGVAPLPGGILLSGAFF